jgi:hypothetical protein
VVSHPSEMDLNVAEPNPRAFRKSSTWPQVPPHEALRFCRQFLVDLLSRSPAPGAPPAGEHGVDVVDLVRHLTTNSRLAEANLTGPPPRLRKRLAGLDLKELLVEWERSGTVVERALRRSHGLAGSLLVTDVFTHELEIRRALGTAEPGCHPAMPTAFDVVIARIGATVGRLGMPALRFKTYGAWWVVGDGEPAVTVSTRPIELYDCLIGRSSPGQIRGLHWSDDPEPWLRVFSRVPLDPPEAAAW